MSAESRIDYVEIPVTDLPRVRACFSELFGWTFREWGDEYMSFHDGRLNGGFRHAETPASSDGVLLVFYSKNLERDLDRVQALGATISEEIFSFPGGRRFHFIDPVGNQYAIWSDGPESAGEG